MPDIEVRGADEVNRSLLNTQSNFDIYDPSSGIRKTMLRAVIRIQARMMEYPAGRTGSSYVRTGTLGRRWTTDVTPTGNDLIGKVGNNTTYGPFVQSEMFQAAIHEGRWQTDAQVMREESPAIESEFAALVSRVVREFGT